MAYELPPGSPSLDRALRDRDAISPEPGTPKGPPEFQSIFADIREGRRSTEPAQAMPDMPRSAEERFVAERVGSGKTSGRDRHHGPTHKYNGKGRALPYEQQAARARAEWAKMNPAQRESYYQGATMGRTNMAPGEIDDRRAWSQAQAGDSPGTATSAAPRAAAPQPGGSVQANAPTLKPPSAAGNTRGMDPPSPEYVFQKASGTVGMGQVDTGFRAPADKPLRTAPKEQRTLRPIDMAGINAAKQRLEGYAQQAKGLQSPGPGEKGASQQTIQLQNQAAAAQGDLNQARQTKANLDAFRKDNPLREVKAPTRNETFAFEMHALRRANAQNDKREAGLDAIRSGAVPTLAKRKRFPGSRNSNPYTARG